jgi:L-rhamnose isomerase / sugar isomerase
MRRKAYAEGKGIAIGAINPNLFQHQRYKYGSACSPWPDAREMADTHIADCLKLAADTGSKHVSLWFADGTNYPGQDDIVSRKRLMEKALTRWHDQTPDGVTLLIEYKPFEPAFYATDIADWGMATLLARKAGPKAKVLVDTGHHYPGVKSSRG